MITRSSRKECTIVQEIGTPNPVREEIKEESTGDVAENFQMPVVNIHIHIPSSSSPALPPNIQPVIHLHFDENNKKLTVGNLENCNSSQNNVQDGHLITPTKVNVLKCKNDSPRDIAVENSPLRTPLKRGRPRKMDSSKRQENNESTSDNVGKCDREELKDTPSVVRQLRLRNESQTNFKKYFKMYKSNDCEDVPNNSQTNRCSLKSLKKDSNVIKGADRNENEKYLTDVDNEYKLKNAVVVLTDFRKVNGNLSVSKSCNDDEISDVSLTLSKRNKTLACVKKNKDLDEDVSKKEDENLQKCTKSNGKTDKKYERNQPSSETNEEEEEEDEKEDEIGGDTDFVSKDMEKITQEQLKNQSCMLDNDSRRDSLETKIFSESTEDEDGDEVHSEKEKVEKRHKSIKNGNAQSDHVTEISSESSEESEKNVSTDDESSEEDYVVLKELSKNVQSQTNDNNKTSELKKVSSESSDESEADSVSKNSDRESEELTNDKIQNCEVNGRLSRSREEEKEVEQKVNGDDDTDSNDSEDDSDTGIKDEEKLSPERSKCSLRNNSEKSDQSTPDKSEVSVSNTEQSAALSSPFKSPPSNNDNEVPSSSDESHKSVMSALSFTKEKILNKLFSRKRSRIYSLVYGSENEETPVNDKRLTLLAEGCNFTDILRKFKMQKENNEIQCESNHSESSPERNNSEIVRRKGKKKKRRRSSPEKTGQSCSESEGETNTVSPDDCTKKSSNSNRETNIVTPRKTASESSDEQTCAEIVEEGNNHKTPEKNLSSDENNFSPGVENGYESRESCNDHPNKSPPTSQNMNKTKSEKFHTPDFHLELIQKEMMRRKIIDKSSDKKSTKKHTKKNKRQKDSSFSKSPTMPKKMKKANDKSKETPRPDSPKTFSTGENYISLNIPGPTKFAVASLDKFTAPKKHSARDFKERMLFGKNVRRFKNSTDHQMYKSKQKATKMYCGSAKK